MTPAILLTAAFLLAPAQDALAKTGDIEFDETGDYVASLQTAQAVRVALRRTGRI